MYWLITAMIFPVFNTIRENLNAVTNETRKLILKCQSLLIIEKGLDDFIHMIRKQEAAKKLLKVS